GRASKKPRLSLPANEMYKLSTLVLLACLLVSANAVPLSTSIVRTNVETHTHRRHAQTQLVCMRARNLRERCMLKSSLQT
ncbi:hypothetical protein GGX14DRAFT_467756, partial [Mycena pura]